MAAPWLRSLIRQLKRRWSPPLERVLESAEFIHFACSNCRLGDLNGELEKLIDEAARHAFRLGLGRDELAGDLAWRLARLERRHEPSRAVINCIAQAVAGECSRLNTPLHRSAMKVLAIQVAAGFILDSMLRSGQVLSDFN